MILADIDEHWSQVEPGLLHVRDKTDAHWEPDDLRQACCEKRAFLFLAPEGFVILRPLYHRDGCVLEVAVAYGIGQDLIAQYFPTIEQLARDIGALRIQFNSPRRGFERVPGWRVSTVTYERDVNYG